MQMKDMCKVYCNIKEMKLCSKLIRNNYKEILSYKVKVNTIITYISKELCPRKDKIEL